MAGRIVRTIAVAACALLVLAANPAAQPVAEAGLMQLNVRDVSVGEVLKLIAESGDFNLAIGGGVKGKVTLFIDEIAPRDLLDVVVGIIDAAYVEENGVIWVMSKENYESIYGQKFVDNLVSRTFVLNQAKVKDIMPSVKALLGDKAIVTPDLSRNSVRIKASPKLVKEASQMIASIDRPLVTQEFPLQNMSADLAAGLLGKMVTDHTTIVEDPVNQRLIVSSSEFEIKQVGNILDMLDVGGGIKSIVLKIGYAQTDSLAEILKSQLTPELGQIHADNRSRKIYVTDYSPVLDRIADMAAEFDVPVRQVLIEAKIIQVATSKNVKTGINWEVLQHEMNLTGTFPALVNTDPGIRGDFGNLASRNYTIMVEALEIYGDTELLSSPRLMVVDGGSGLIHVGSQVPYTTIDTKETPGGTINQFEKVIIVDVGVKLEVQVNIYGDDMIAMKIRPEVSAVTGYSDADIPIVDATTLDSSLMVKDGNTVILGGLIKDEIRTVRKGIPILSSIPLLKYLFSSTEEETIKGELVILLTPKILTGREDYDEENGY
jgi:type II secretory pathway component GspD/PulD (secretin)